MKTFSKRLIFFSLFSGFILLTVITATTGTAVDPGAGWNTPQAISGMDLYQEFNCTACHQLYGLGGYMGPDLTNVISAKGKGEQYARAFLESGSARMPDFNLTSSEVDNLVAFLTYVDKTGISPVKNFRVRIDGTVEQLPP